LKLVLGVPAPEKDETEVRWLISYSDFMMQLVCLFILLYAASLLGKDKLAIVARSYRAAVGLPEPAAGEVPGAGAPTSVDPPLAGGRLGPADLPPRLAVRLEEVRGVRFVRFERPLFEPGSASLTPAARAHLDEAAGRLRPYAGRVFVTATAGPSEGDGDPVRLAQARAEAAVLHVGRDRFEAAIDPRFVQAGGRVVEEAAARQIHIELRGR